MGFNVGDGWVKFVGFSGDTLLVKIIVAQCGHDF